jgi:hypothetical protein
MFECLSNRNVGRREGLPVRGAGYEPADAACLQAVFSRAECPQQLYIKNAGAVIDAGAANDRSPPPAFRTTTTAAHQPTRITACGETRIIREAHLNQSISSYLTILAPQACTTRSLPPQPASCCRSIVPTGYGMGVARERAPPLKSTGTHKRLEEEGGYTQAYAYTQACGFCHPRVAGCTQKIRHSCVASTHEGFRA